MSNDCLCGLIATLDIADLAHGGYDVACSFIIRPTGKGVAMKKEEDVQEVNVGGLWIVFALEVLFIAFHLSRL